jgi:hypothetical protein
MMLAKDNVFFAVPSAVKFPAMASNLAFKVCAFQTSSRLPFINFKQISGVPGLL